MNFRLGFLFEERERKTAILSALLLFAITAAFVILKSARDALFLSDYPARILPYFMAITPVATALVSVTYLRLYRSLTLKDAVEVSLKAFAIGTLLLWAAIRSNWHYGTPVLYIWAGVYGSLAPVQAWSLISQQLLTRQAKRSFGLIGAGGIAGASAGGFFTKWVAEASSVSALLPAATILIILGLLAAQALSTLGYTSTATSRPLQPAHLRPRFITYVLIIVGIASIVTTWADFQFKVTAQSKLSTAEALASFFGSFNAYSNIATLAFQVLITPALMNRIGVSSALALLPFGLAIGNGWMLFTGSLAAAIFLKGSDQVFRFSIYRSSLEVLYMAIPERTKVRLKSLIDSVGVRTAEGIAGLLLIAMFSVGHLSLPVLAGLSLFLLAVSLGCSFLLSREYPKALSGAIRQDEVNFSSVRAQFFTTDFYYLLPELLGSSSRETVLDLLQMLGATGTRNLQTYLLPLLEHPDAEVRLKALQLLFDQEQDVSEQVHKLTADQDRRIRVEAIHYLCFRSSIDPVEKLAHLLTDPEPTIQAAACACSLNQDMGPVQQMAYERLEQLLNKQEPAFLDARLEVAHILEYVRPSPSSVELCRRLLSDPSPEVRRATLRSIAETRPAGILPALIQLLSDYTVRAEVRDALASYGDTVMPQMKAFLDDRNVLLDQKKLILRILADIGTPEAADVLVAAAMGPNLVLRFIATKALNKIKKRRMESLPKDKLPALLDQEITALEVELQRTQFISPDPRGVLHAVLNQRRNWAKERIFRVLGLLYDSKSIYNAYVALSGSDKRRADWALEYLDAALAPEHRYRVLGLLEFPDERNTPTPEARKNVLFGYIGASDQLPAAAMIADLSDAELAQWKAEIYDVLSAFPNQVLVEETLDWRYLRMKQPDNIQQKLTTIQKLEYLNKVEIFSRLGPQELLMLANVCVQSDYAAGEIIFKEGDLGQEIFLLVSGLVQQKRVGTTHTVKPGHPFGTLSVLSDQPRLFSATAIEPSVCLRVPKSNFWEVLEDYPSVSQVIFRTLAQRIRDLTEGKDISTDTKTLV